MPMLPKGLEKQLNILDFSLSSLWRRKLKVKLPRNSRKVRSAGREKFSDPFSTEGGSKNHE